MRATIIVAVLLVSVAGCSRGVQKTEPAAQSEANPLRDSMVRTASSRPALQVSGVMISDKPSAIVNGNILGVGMEINGAVVKEISGHGVAFDFQGDMFTVALNNTADQNGAVSGPRPDQQQSQTSETESPQGNAYQDHLRKAGAYVAGAQEIVRQNRVMAIKDYDAVLALYDEGQAECRTALEQAPVDVRGSIRKLLASIRNDRQIFLAAKSGLSRRIREAIDQHKLTFGMTASNVKQSIGRPDRIQRSGDADRYFEQWEYEERDGVISKCLYFYNEIFVAHK